MQPRDKTSTVDRTAMNVIKFKIEGRAVRIRAPLEKAETLGTPTENICRGSVLVDVETANVYGKKPRRA